jgi:hypothetical protein
MRKFIFALAIMTTVVVVQTPLALAQGNAHPPIGLFGNPHDFRPGPPIPSCSANFNQGPPNDPIKGCRVTP